MCKTVSLTTIIHWYLNTGSKEVILVYSESQAASITIFDLDIDKVQTLRHHNKNHGSAEEEF